MKEKGVTIWNDNSSKDFLDICNLSHLEEGDCGANYSFQWRHFGATYESCDKEYKGQGIDQIKYIIDEIKQNPTSRRLIFSAWNPVDIPNMALPPCHVLAQFNVTPNTNLSLDQLPAADQQSYCRASLCYHHHALLIASKNISDKEECIL